ncbi:MAG: YihY/virulence factor BrkB family protein [Lautropia sp.]|nr:YihY/virulence factor BrkB family protein [Lautropia sp.]
MNLDPEYQLAALQARAGRARHARGTGYRSWGYRALGVLLVVLRDVAFGQLTLRAMSLVYTTLLSLVPLLALSFSVLKAFGVHNQIEPALARFLAPLGERGDAVTDQIIQFIGNMNVGVLGSLGLALLLYTAISLVQKIEVSFNYIWHVPEPRSFGTRFSSYLSVLLVGPLLVFSALGLTAAATSIGVVQGLLAIEPLGWLAAEAGKLVPYALIIGLFAFIYIFIPNTRVRWGPAIGGALVGGIAWQTAGWGFASFVATSSQYTAIYSGFAIVILFMIWIYVSWLIVLIGASVSFYLQHGEYIMVKAGEPALSGRMRERLALLVMQRIAQQHAAGGAPLSLEDLTSDLAMPSYAIRQLLDLMTAKGLLVPTRATPCTWVPLRDLSGISAWQVIEAVRAEGEHQSFAPEALVLPEALERLVSEQERAAEEVLRTATLRSLVDQEAPAIVPAAARAEAAQSATGTDGAGSSDDPDGLVGVDGLNDPDAPDAPAAAVVDPAAADDPVLPEPAVRNAPVL